MKTYLVTGGAGFIGSNYINYLFEEYHHDIFLINLDKLTYAGNLENLKKVENNPNYKFIKADICDKDTLKNIFAEYDIDYVVNFAAESHVDRSIESSNVFVKTNILGTHTLLNAAKNAWAAGNGFLENKKFLQISTDEVYGSLGANGKFTEDTPLAPHNPYSASKASADLIVKAYYDTYAFPCNITRCSNNYGEYQYPEKLIPLIINNAMKHEDLPVYGDGKQIRDWLYVQDHIRAVEKVLRKAEPGEVYNIGGNNEYENIYLVNKIIEILSLELKDSEINGSLIKHVKDRLGHDRRYALDSSKIARDLGWQPEVAFDAGIERIVKWYINNAVWMKNAMRNG
ncbi:MAG: dTDP-glucose 4,6-dehydratase [Clostridia bacterium]|nr:dTDP-glucose 4,6-dehydratase [Clostridia bacterium]